MNAVKLVNAVFHMISTLLLYFTREEVIEFIARRLDTDYSDKRKVFFMMGTC